MFKKTVTYTDLNGEETTEDLYFHMSQAELVELEMSEKDGWSEAMKKIVDAEDGKTIMAEFKRIILNSYGVRSTDGKRFIKTQELRDEFESSEAYSALFMELVTNTDFAIEFINGIAPAKMINEAAEKMRTTNLQAVPDENKDKQQPAVVTRADVAKMDADALADLGARISRGEVKIEDDIPPAG